ncbi:hypothetical protein [Porphyromonas catoniae]|jgi:hypothetical protein|uniref:Uncharacterized protein n=1 Tax=Porphyromonas catoniae ATCC 51270 TaxID=887901 RepID=Z4WV65_9PORP|nr:hypothetical protein [Porphyromonas catoniae]EWC93188.1 hypothetical protein HMPREF0636_1090 [Porphyromonas catoniae ATCC 51270]DAV05674.1 MAG TPA: major capsid protein [Caudoviricetes sp.]
MKKLSSWVAPLVVTLGVLAIDAAVGALLALLIGIPAWIGSVVLLLALLCVGVIYKPGNINAGVAQEVWTGVMVKKLREALEHLGWYTRIPSYDEHVENDVIHFVELGGDPKVLIDNNTYPLNVQELQDGDRAVSLANFETEATAISDKELDTISYDKLGSVKERHKEAVAAEIIGKALHAIAPQTHSEADSPVFVTSGDTAAEGGRKKLTLSDLLRLKKWFDGKNIPQGQRVLVLCSDHVQDLLSVSETFLRQYNLDNVNGMVGRLYGFDIYEMSSSPLYDATAKTKLAYGAVAQAKHKPASIAYHDKSMMRATGTLKTYSSKAEEDPLHHRNLFNVRQRAICMPLRSKGCTAALVSATA